VDGELTVIYCDSLTDIQGHFKRGSLARIPRAGARARKTDVCCMTSAYTTLELAKRGVSERVFPVSGATLQRVTSDGPCLLGREIA
jgi:hypothetical protein